MMRYQDEKGVWEWRHLLFCSDDLQEVTGLRTREAEQDKNGDVDFLLNHL
jgi:hypothetical protein